MQTLPSILAQNTIRRLTGVALFCLLILLAPSAMAQQKVMIILDASGSMWGQIDGVSKIATARQTLDTVLDSAPEDAALGLMAYGHRRKGDCKDIEVLVPVGTKTADRIRQAVATLNPKGKTPLTASVRQAAEALKYTEDQATVVLVTDGLETCKSDPCALASELENKGLDFTTHVIGFGLNKDEGRQVACLAEQTGGLYLGAQNAAELADALEVTVTEPQAADTDQTDQAAASLDADASVAQGARFTVSWYGPGDRYDAIQIFDPNALAGDGRIVRSRQVQQGDMENRTVRLTAPAVLGTYLLRYFDGRNRHTLAEREIQVVETQVALEAPAQIGIGERLSVVWQGPGGRYDAVEVFDPSALNGTGKVVHRKRLRNDDFENRRASMPAPATTGTYQIRYWNGENKAVLATRPIEVVPAEVMLSADDTFSVGQKIKVAWKGPGGRYDDVQLFDPAGNNGEGRVIRRKRLRNDDFENRNASLPAPGKPGSYLLRYWNGDNKKVLATLPITIVPANVSLSFDGDIEQAQTIVVTWTGPGARYDNLQIYDPKGNNGEGKVVHKKNLRHGDFDNRIVGLPAPAKTGPYELRYWNGDNKVVLAVVPITVKKTQVSIAAPDVVATDQPFEVEWVGPGARLDAIQIIAANGKSVRGRRLRNADFDNRKVKLRAPAKTGTYTLRYWNGENRAVLATRPLTVE